MANNLYDTGQSKKIVVEHGLSEEVLRLIRDARRIERGSDTPVRRPVAIPAEFQVIEERKLLR